MAMIEQINGTATLLKEELKSLQNDKENEKINSRLKSFIFNAFEQFHINTCVFALPFQRLVGICCVLWPKNEVDGKNDLPIVPLILKVDSFQRIKIENFLNQKFDQK